MIVCFSLLMSGVAVSLQAQDLPAYKRIVKELSSARYQGRGYAKNGVRKAGRFIEKEFRKAGVDEVITQPFCLDVNTFPGVMKMSVDGKRLVAGQDFVLREFSPGIHDECKLYHVDTLRYDSERLFADLEKPENKGALVVCDFWFTYKHPTDFKRLQSAECANAGLIYTWETPLKFYKAYAEKVADKPVIWTMADAVRGAKSARMDIDNRFYKDYESNNVIACVRGERHDSCYMFTAHYDHLGNLGRKVFYAGANDNASGTASIITLAAYFAKNKPPYDVWFVAFSGEDTNLRGSTYFVEHPIVPLENIKYLFNIDMVGDNNPQLYCELSEKGMPAFPLWERLNKKGGYFTSLDRGELAANSDHYPFAVRGVPCIFVENKEGDAFPFYHTTEDNWQHAVTDSYEPLFRLVVDFISSY